MCCMLRSRRKALRSVSPGGVLLDLTTLKRRRWAGGWVAGTGACGAVGASHEQHRSLNMLRRSMTKCIQFTVVIG